MHLVYIVHFKTGGQDITKANIHCNHVGQCLLLQYLQVGYKLGLGAQQKLWSICLCDGDKGFVGDIFF